MTSSNTNTLLETESNNNQTLTPTVYTYSFPSLELLPTDDLGIIDSKEIGPAKVSMDLEMLRSGTHGGRPCALILMDLSFIFPIEHRLRSATIVFTLSGEPGQNPSFIQIAPRHARGTETPVEHNQTQQLGAQLMAAASPAFTVSFNATGTRGVTYTTYAAPRITSLISYSDRRNRSITNRVDFVIEENSVTNSGIPRIVKTGLIVLLEKEGDKFHIDINVRAKQSFVEDSVRSLKSLFRTDTKQLPHLLDPSSRPIQGPEKWERLVDQCNDWANLDLENLVLFPEISKLPPGN